MCFVSVCSPPKPFHWKHALLHVFGLSASQATSILIWALPLVKRAAWCMAFSPGGHLWSDNGLVYTPGRKPIPVRQRAAHLCALSRVYVCVGTECRSVYKHRCPCHLLPACLFSPSSVTVSCRRSMPIFSRAFCFSLSITLHLSSLCHSYWFCFAFLASAA